MIKILIVTEIIKMLLTIIAILIIITIIIIIIIIITIIIKDVERNFNWKLKKCQATKYILNTTKNITGQWLT